MSTNTQQPPRMFHLGAQNDGWYIISGRAPASTSDYPDHDADRTCIAKVFDEAEARRLIGAANGALAATSAVPTYWDGAANGYSRATAAASAAVRAAEQALQCTLKSEYPLGAGVRVVHSRGSFYATVVGWDYYGARVAVVNDATGKTSKWWAAHVELRSDE